MTGVTHLPESWSWQFCGLFHVSGLHEDSINLAKYFRQSETVFQLTNSLIITSLEEKS